MSTYRTEFRCGERIGRLDGVASRTSIAVSLPPTLDSGTLAFGPKTNLPLLDPTANSIMSGTYNRTAPTYQATQASKPTPTFTTQFRANKDIWGPVGPKDGVGNSLQPFELVSIELQGQTGVHEAIIDRSRDLSYIRNSLPLAQVISETCQRVGRSFDTSMPVFVLHFSLQHQQKWQVQQTVFVEIGDAPGSPDFLMIAPKALKPASGRRANLDDSSAVLSSNKGNTARVNKANDAERPKPAGEATTTDASENGNRFPQGEHQTGAVLITARRQNPDSDNAKELFGNTPSSLPQLTGKQELQPRGQDKERLNRKISLKPLTTLTHQALEPWRAQYAARASVKAAGIVNPLACSQWALLFPFDPGITLSTCSNNADSIGIQQSHLHWPCDY